MPLAPDGSWLPNLAARQIELLQCRKRYLLASGPRYSGKTISALHKATLHAWNVNEARVAMVGISQTSTADEGSWSALTKMVIPEWIKGDFGLQWKRKPYIDNVTKKPKCTIINRHGTESCFQLESLPDEDTVEERFKNKNYSMIYMVELSNFRSRKTFDIITEALRVPYLTYDDHQFLSDTNPADEGEDSWIYKMWYEFRVRDDLLPAELPFQESLGLMEFTIEDNTFADPRRVADLKSKYLHSPDLYDRYILGKWTRSTGDGIFADVFRPALHVVGDISSQNQEIMLPEENCSELGSGWDMGHVNHSAHVIEPFRMYLENGTETTGYKVLDELVFIDQQVTTDDFAAMMLAKMDAVEKLAGKRVFWNHWSDRSAFERWNATSDNYDHMIVFNVTKGRVELKAADRAPKSVYQRIRLVRKLLFEGRLFISAQCVKTIEMLTSLKRKRGHAFANGEMQIDRGSRHKHVLDSLSYYLMMQCYDEVERTAFRPASGTVEAPALMSVNF